MSKKDDSARSIYTLKSNKEKNLDTIPCRLEFIKELLKGQNIDPLIEVSKDDDESGESFDTRHKLKKKTLDFATVIDGIGGRLDYVKSGTTGHTFHGICGNDIDNPDYDYAVKVSAFHKKAKYGSIYDVRRPENAEVNMIRTLSKLIINNHTPHIVLPICTFDTSIDNFVNLMEDGYVEGGNKKYAEFVEKYKKGDYYDNVSILISEWANKGDFLDYTRKNYRIFSPLHWKVFFFQIISALAVIQSQFSSFRHNDLKANNVLVQRTKKQNKNFNYRVVRTSYKVPNIGYQIKIWDFDFACIPGLVENHKVNKPWTKAINVTPDSNRYYDLHYFFNTFIKKGFFPQFMTEDCIPQEAKDFVMRVVPKKYQKGKFVHERGRILIDYEFTTPDEVLKTDEYFAEFRSKEPIHESESTKNKSGGRRKKRKSKSRENLHRSVNTNESESHNNIRRLLEGSGNDTNYMEKKLEQIIKEENRKKRKSKSKSKRKQKIVKAKKHNSPSEDIKKKKASKSKKRKKEKTVSEKVRGLDIDDFLMKSNS